MKRLLLSALFFVICGVAMAQEKEQVKNDPTYSVNNYKHWNKAEFARKHNLDKLISLETSLVSINENYKQPFNTVTVKKAVVAARPMDKSTKSYKHPNGL